MWGKQKKKTVVVAEPPPPPPEPEWAYEGENGVRYRIIKTVFGNGTEYFDVQTYHSGAWNKLYVNGFKSVEDAKRAIEGSIMTCIDYRVLSQEVAWPSRTDQQLSDAHYARQTENEATTMRTDDENDV